MGHYMQEARLYMDGNSWCAVPPGFRNLAIDPAGFGDTKEAAVQDLMRWVAADLTVDDFVVGGMCRLCSEFVEDGAGGCGGTGCPWQADSAAKPED